jgi:outer membrane protein assembly factor BamD (BamD/ComL family)
MRIICLFALLFFTQCIQDDLKDDQIPLETVKDWYEYGLTQIAHNDYDDAIESFNKGISIGDEVLEEYYVSMCLYEIAFTYSLKGDTKKAITYIDKILTKFISSQKPRILAQNLKERILAGQNYKNASY